MFAVTGFDGTSVQKVADAVGYSKTGLLHRFPSKQALYDAVVAEARGVADELLADVAAIPATADRSRRVTELVARAAFARPGLLRLVSESVRPAAAGPAREELEQLGLRIVDALAPGASDPLLRLRTVLALNLVASAVLCQSLEPDALDRRQVQDLAVDLAAAVLGRPG
jgi:AcrR family transcriptional regulator